MSYRVVFSVSSRADAIEAFRWIAEQSPAAAARWYTKLEKAIATLAQMPERYPVAIDESELFGFTLRQMLHGRRPGVYRILYSIEGSTVTLHYIRHSARGPIEPEE